MSHPAAAEKYVALTTYRQDGTGVPTPVWVAPLGDDLVVITLADAWKVRRLRRDPRVRLQPCDVRGRVAEGAPVWTGTGVVLDDPEDVAQVKRAMSRKYPLARLGNAVESVAGRLMGRKPRAGLRLTITG